MQGFTAWQGLVAIDYVRRPRLDPLAMISANRALLAFNLTWQWERAERLPAAGAGFERLAPQPPHVGAALPFDRAPEAPRLRQGGGTIGKVVLTVQEAPDLTRSPPAARGDTGARRATTPGRPAPAPRRG